jgi:hypothetical protein
MQTRDMLVSAALAVAIVGPATSHAATLIGDSVHALYPFSDSTTVSQGSGVQAVGVSTPVGNPPGLSSVPEPAAWSMMLIGLAGLGTAMRARRRATAARA